MLHGELSWGQVSLLGAQKRAGYEGANSPNLNSPSSPSPTRPSAWSLALSFLVQHLGRCVGISMSLEEPWAWQ